MDGRRGGWVVFGCFLTLTCTAGVTLFVLPVLLDSIIAETQWSLTQVSSAVTVFGLSAAVVSPLIGFLIDRFGARNIMVFGVVTGAAATFLLGRVTELWHLHVAMLIASIGSISSTYIPIPALIAR